MHWNKVFIINSSKFISSLLFICVVLIFCQFTERTAVDALRIEFRPRDWKSQLKNQTNKWEKMLKGHAIKRARKITKLDQLPDIPKERVQRIIKLQTSKNQYNPCLVVQNLCVNGGTCHAVDGEWFCNCSSKHYGRSCEFLADHSKCDDNLCRNNATCYSVKEPRTVPNIELTPQKVEKCSKNEVKTGKKDPLCAFTVTTEYRCWCKLGFEGDFCEFSEGERCCVEDHCNHHGLITDLFHASDAQTCDSGKHCNCTCEENYTGSNCEQVSPCRDRECLNNGKCVFNASVSDEAHCQCPTRGFLLGGVKISGNYCETIEFNEKWCNPCGNGGFSSYLNCLRESYEGIENKFAKHCGTGLCTDKLKKGFCMNGGQCQVTVANFTDLNTNYPLLLIPMCQCDSERFEGDFCEHELLDECDKRDLLLNVHLFVNVTAERRVSTPGTEEFLRELKNSIFGVNSKIAVGDSEDRRLASQGFEHILGRAGMLTFCGENGYCRPYNEEAGFECKCDHGFKGSRCEVKDPCSNIECPAHSLCVDIPPLDESNSPDEQNNLTSACICKTSQEVNEKTSACENQINDQEYTACFVEGGEPKCQNNGHCYPCALDNKMVRVAQVYKARLPLCNQHERKSGIRCICPPGFAASSLCHNVSRPCDFNRCQNKAKCIAVPVPDNLLNYECECKPGYNGSLCEKVEDACRAGATCGNGTCVLDVTLARGFRCNCVYGYFGFNCEQIRPTGWFAYFNENYQWTYPLLAFLLLAPVNLVVVVVQERRTRAKYGALENAPSYYAVLSNYVN